MNPLLLSPLLDLAGKVFDKIFPDKEAAERARLELMRQSADQDFQLILKQAEANIEEAKHPNVFISGWRPFIGWVCGAGLAWNFLGHPIAVWAAKLWFPMVAAPNLVSDNLLELAFVLLGMAGWRTLEKVKGVASK